MQEKEPQFFRKEGPEKIQVVQERPIEKLAGLIREISIDFRMGGIPIKENGRIDMNEFHGIYPKKTIEADQQWSKGLKEVWERAAISGNKLSWILSREQIKAQMAKNKPMGEVLEMLAMAILHKNLGKDFIVCRTSEYDDVRNHVDNIILDRKTGNVVCAFDDVGDDSGRIFEEKKRAVLKRNWEGGGADLFYGISLSEKDGKTELRRGQVSHIPLFYFACRKDDIQKILETFTKMKISLEEQKIFREFINSFGKQIGILKKGPLHQKLEQRIKDFEGIINTFKDVVK